MNADPLETVDDGMPGIGLVRGLIQRILGTSADITATARLEADLQLESLDLLMLGDLLREHCGPQVDLCARIASLDFDDLIRLTVADVAAYVAGQVDP